MEMQMSLIGLKGIGINFCWFICDYFMYMRELNADM